MVSMELVFHLLGESSRYEEDLDGRTSTALCCLFCIYHVLNKLL